MAKEAEKVRLQVALCSSLAKDLARHAEELCWSQSWVAGWAVRCALDDPASFAKWMERRLKEAAKHQKWKPTAGEKETRLQLRVEPETARRLELAAVALNQSPLKLGGLMIEHTLDDSSAALWLLKTQLGKFLRRVIRGPEDPEAQDVEELEEEPGGNSSSAAA
jgi:hypothetical protein